jgi:c-di-GMP-binding flagellar brake protein YcgR
MSPIQRRSSPRHTARRLVALRCVEAGKVTWTGFASTLDLSATGTLLESPDRFAIGQRLALEFLLDENQVVQVEGTVSKVAKAKKMYHLAIEFDKLNAQAKRLLAKA